MIQPHDDTTVTSPPARYTAAHRLTNTMYLNTSSHTLPLRERVPPLVADVKVWGVREVSQVYYLSMEEDPQR